MNDWITVFAPATVANLGPGYDLLGMALERPGDTVAVRLTEEPGVCISSIEGDGGLLSADTDRNMAGIAAKETLALAHSQQGIELRLIKGLPIGSGLGSSAASAVAAALAVNVALGEPLSRQELLAACREAERVATGAAHADNVAPAMLGGITLIVSYDPFEVVSLPVPSELVFMVATPAVQVPTKQAREILPATIPLVSLTHNAGYLAALIVSLFRGDPEMFGRAIKDIVVEPVRATLIPGYRGVKEAAMEAGALGFSISGAGPSVFAVLPDRAAGASVAAAVQSTWSVLGIACTTVISPVNTRGAYRLGEE